MYALTALLSRFARYLSTLRTRFNHWREHREHGKDCLFCAHHDLALRRTPKYTCPRCDRVYTRKEE